MKSLINKGLAVLLFSTSSTLVAASTEEVLLEPGKLPITSETFTCIRDMTKVRGFYVDNLKGDLEATLAVANSEIGGVYPPGSVVQLVPGEVMVKHGVGSVSYTHLTLPTNREV